eukprot:GFUD01036484.1.p1 GENE.GFUD01036484.1~~GFUD01036484.1.p1  ORF type:complete len:277 (+),score=66.25 GFUD01036484.1:75-905(+)
MGKFCLKWNEFETNIRDSIMELREEQNHFDVTLAFDDDYQIDAHKIILSAGSKNFRNKLSKNKHPIPFIYLNGMKRVELEYVLEFLYNEKGQKKLVDTKSNVNPKFTDLEMKHRTDPSTNHQESMLDPLEISADTFENSDDDLVIKEEDDSDDFSVQKEEYHSDDVFVLREEHNLVLNTNLEIDLQTEQMIEKSEGLWQCKVCGKTSKLKQITRRHAERHIEGVSHSCHICKKTFSTRNSVKGHIINSHSEFSFTCTMCGKSGMNKMANYSHKRNC